jgi:hypothetical protein
MRGECPSDADVEPITKDLSACQFAGSLKHIMLSVGVHRGSRCLPQVRPVFNMTFGVNDDYSTMMMHKVSWWRSSCRRGSRWCAS